MAILKDSVRGHSSIFKFWNEFLNRDQSTATLGFIGPDGVGKRKAAWALMQQALCIHTPDVCGTCGHCLRVAGGAHESILWIQPEKDLIKVEKAREVLDFLSFKSLTKKRFVVLEQAELLNQQAANSLLKTLEEPPENTFFILISANETGLMPTIRSRSMMFKFKPLSDSDLRGEKIIPDWIVRASRGSFSRLENLSRAETQSFRKEAAELLLTVLKDPNFLIKSDWRDAIKDRDFFRALWPFWLELMRDVLWLQTGRKDLLICPDQGDVLKNLAQLNNVQVEKIISAITQFEKELSVPKDPQLVFEHFYVQNFHQNGIP